MINLYNAQIESISIHRIGNKSRNERFLLSAEPYKLKDEIVPLIKEFFLKPFREKEENYFQFAHEVDLAHNELFNAVSSVFAGSITPHEGSRRIADHLFHQSNHPHIKSGELCVVHFTNLSIDNVPTDGIGIFKSEIQSDFLRFTEKDNRIEMLLQHGVSLDKLDKGALIFNYKKEDGYKILSVDSNRYDARYWLEHFLNVDTFQDENFITKKYLKFCQDFAKEVVLPAEDKKEEVMFLNRSVNYFAKNDQFEESNFLNEVLDNPDLVPEFKNYKVDKGAKFSIEDVTSFPISNSAVSDARKNIKNVIKLDTNVTIKLDFVNPESAERFLEKGFDEDRQMYYYLVYFNKEQK